MNEIDTIRGLLAEAIRLRDANQANEAALAFAKIVPQFDKSTDPVVRENVAEALLNLGVLFRNPEDRTSRARPLGRNRVLKNETSLTRGP